MRLSSLLCCLPYAKSNSGQEDTVAPAGSKSKQTKSSKPEAYSAQRAAALYSNYVDPDEPSVIGPEGFERLCSDMDISLEGALPLILAWQMKASEMAKITRSEWDVATAELQISSLQALSTALRDVEDALILGKAPSTSPPSAPMQAKKKGAMPSGPYNRSRYQIYATDTKKALCELYSFCFTLVKSPQGRNIDMETASAFWSVLLVPQYPLMSDLLEFINEKGSYKGVNKDLWNMTREFCQSVNRDLSDYEADGAWPTMIDDFVAWKNNNRADADITIERDTA